MLSRLVSARLGRRRQTGRPNEKVLGTISEQHGVRSSFMALNCLLTPNWMLRN